MRWVITALSVHLAQSQAAGPEEDHYALPHHSFKAPVTYDDSLQEWYMSGATMANKKSILLVPGILGRAGMFFNKQPLLTSDFNLEAEFTVTSPQRPHNPEANLEQKLAFWYVHHNTSAAFSESVVMQEGSWQKGLEKMGWDFVGFKREFDGMGVVFSNSPGTGPYQQVSVITNDGSKKMTESEMFKAPTKSLRFRSAEYPAKVVLKVRVKDASAAVEVWMHNHQLHRFEVHSDVLHKGGYIGFSAWTGNQKEGQTGIAPDTQADRVELHRITAHNMDMSIAGEAVEDMDASTYVNWVASNEQAQKQMLERVLARLTKHHDSTVKLQRETFSSIVNLQTKVHALEGQCSVLSKEYKMLDKNGVQDVKDHLIGLRRVFQNNAKNRESTIEQMQNHASGADSGANDEHMARMKEESQKLIEQVQSQGSSFSFYMFLIVACGMGVAFGLYKKMSYYERKHLL